jgi:hypothetical protein
LGFVEKWHDVAYGLALGNVIFPEVSGGCLAQIKSRHVLQGLAPMHLQHTDTDSRVLWNMCIKVATSCQDHLEKQFAVIPEVRGCRHVAIPFQYGVEGLERNTS